MDSYLYKHLLTICLIPFAQSKYNEDYALHQDNDPKHNSGLLGYFYDEMNINLITIIKIIKLILVFNRKFC